MPASMSKRKRNQASLGISDSYQTQFATPRGATYLSSYRPRIGASLLFEGKDHGWKLSASRVDKTAEALPWCEILLLLTDGLATP